MKSIKLIPIAAITLITFYSCNPNKKLNQKNAEKAIKEFVSTHSLDDIPGTSYGHFDLNHLASILPVSQFSETEASADAVFPMDYSRPLVFRFVFQKNIDNHWILMHIKEGGYNNGITESIILPNQNINIVAQ